MADDAQSRERGVGNVAQGSANDCNGAVSRSALGQWVRELDNGDRLIACSSFLARQDRPGERFILPQQLQIRRRRWPQKTRKELPKIRIRRPRKYALIDRTAEIVQHLFDIDLRNHRLTRRSQPRVRQQC
jgi:hypothetical protein